MRTPPLRTLSLLTLLACSALAARAAAPVLHERLTKLWESSEPLPGASAALHDEKADVIYVSRAEGTAKEGNLRGAIARLGTDGKVLAAEWLGGLEAPRGLARTATRLIVADGQELFSVDPERVRIASRYRNDTAKRLHAVAVLANGTVYATDTAGGSLFELRDGIFGRHGALENLPANTGLAAVADELLLGQRYRITGFKPAAESSRDVVRRAVAVESFVALGDGTFVVADGKGTLHLVGAGIDKAIKLLETGAPADGLGLIGLIAKNRVLLVPQPGAGRVTAYQLR